eukprot:TRINITY_DN7170_c0_g1_i2.p1 TRINITY_DN7170_c0_g1~~TRINITY_DN7170_c0_g1_i2.p1  ORF type:complete len:498 (+),score=133.94 TRINITY_DN7170_c0_g1_i2:62-1555(+)
MALRCVIPACDCEGDWCSRRDEARTACADARYFEAVQLINTALETLQVALRSALASTEAPLNLDILITEPLRFVDQAMDAGALSDAPCVGIAGSTWASQLAELYHVRADIFAGLGGLRRAEVELKAAVVLAPEVDAVTLLLEDVRRRLAADDEDGAPQATTASGEDKVPAHLLTGFLGSGKTTLLNNILHGSHGKRYAVIENEFGEIGIDDALIQGREDTGAEQIVEMNNGCICCTVRGDLIKGLKNILKRAAEDGVMLDGVLIETTGLADPAPVAQTFFADEYIQARMVLDGIITVVDAKHVLQHLREEKPEGVENEAVEQIAFADRVLLNKVDLVTTDILEEVEREIRAINAPVAIIRTEHSKVDMSEIIGIRGFSLDRVLESEPDFLRDDQEHEHDSTVSSVGIESSGECDLERLNQWIATLLKEKGTDIFRMKGILAVKGCDSPFVFQGIHMIFGGQPQGAWKVERTNKFVFIGRNLNRAELQAGFRSVLACD